MTDGNRHTGQVALPEAGEGAYIQFTIGALEKLEDAYGEDYINVIVKGLAKMRVKVYQGVIANTLHGSSNGDVPYGMTWEALNIRILDALHLALYGRTYEEHLEWERKQVESQMEGLSENPKLAAILSFLSAEKQEPGPDSDHGNTAA